jgi:hypothetical protein
MFVVPVFYLLIAADHHAEPARAEAEHALPALPPLPASPEVA